jgi:hypothetical protein
MDIAAAHAAAAAHAVAAEAASTAVAEAASTAVAAAAAMVVAADTGDPGSLLTKGPSASAGGLFSCPQIRVSRGSMATLTPLAR